MFGNNCAHNKKCHNFNTQQGELLRIPYSRLKTAGNSPKRLGSILFLFEVKVISTKQMPVLHDFFLNNFTV